MSRSELTISTEPLLPELKSLAVENAIERTWQYYVNESHLPSGRRELGQDFAILLISSGAFLYAMIADKYAESYPDWIRGSYDGATVLSAAIILVNATNEFIWRRGKRHIPKELQAYNLRLGKWQQGLGDAAVLSVSAVASVSLTTAAWRYSSSWPNQYRIPWAVFIELVNTGLHLLPVELVAFNHPVFSLPIKPFIWSYNKIRKQFLSTKEKSEEKFMVFKRQRAEELANRLIKNLDQGMQEIIDGHFQWNGFSNGVKKWFSYVKKPSAELKDYAQIEIKDILRSPPDAVQTPPNNKALLALLYMIGAIWVVSSNLGFLADPPATLQDSGMDKSSAWVLSAPAIYFLGVLLAHMGGASFQADILRIPRVLQGQESMPLQAKLHTKSFGLAFLISLYAAPFASAAAEQMVADHFGDSWLELPLIWAAKTGVAYFTLAVLNKFYADYVTKWVRFNAGDENHLIALLKERVEYFKRHIPSDPDILVDSLKQYNPLDLPLLIGMTESEFLTFTDFSSQYAASGGEQSLGRTSISRDGSDLLDGSINMSPSRPKAPSNASNNCCWWKESAASNSLVNPTSAYMELVLD